MQRFRSWIEDGVGGAIAEIEAFASPPTPSGAVGELVLKGADSLTIRRPVRPGARFYLKTIGLSIVEASWPFTGQAPLWTSALERRSDGWDIVVHMTRSDVLEIRPDDAIQSQTPVNTIWLYGGAGPALEVAPEIGWLNAAKRRLAVIAALCAIALGGPVFGLAEGLQLKSEMVRLEEKAREASAPIRDAMRAQRAAATAEAALAKALAAPGLAGLLINLAHPLPEEARLTSVAIKADEVRLDGRAPSATAVLSAYSDMTGLTDVRFDGAVSALPSGQERFAIVAKRIVTSAALE